MNLEDLDQEPEPRKRRVRLTSAAGIPPKRAKWLWQGRLAIGTLAILAGREGVGKSTLGYWIAAQLTQGTLPGEHHGKPAAVLVAATEDSWCHVIIPRLIAAGADLALIYRVDVTTDLAAGELSLPVDVRAVGEASQEVGAALLLLDPLMSRLSATLDTHRDSEVRQALEPLTRMLDSTGMVAVGLLHHNKSGSDDPLTSLMGSRAFAAVARSVHTVVRDPDDDSGARRLFGTVKNNLGPDLSLMSFTLEPFTVPTTDGDAATARIRWGDHVAGVTISDVMARANGTREDRTAVQEAADWLSDYLSSQGGQAESTRIYAAGLVAKHHERLLRRAKDKLHVTTSTFGFPRKTVWHLPEDDPHPRPQSGHSSPDTPGETYNTVRTVRTGDSPASPASPASPGSPRESVRTGGQVIA